MESEPLPELTTSALWDLLATQSQGVLATIKRDGRPQLSNIAYHYDPATRALQTRAATFRAKAKNMQRDPRVSIHVSSPDFRLWVVAEGIAQLDEPVRNHQDEIGQRMIAYIRMGYPDLTDAELDEHMEQFPLLDRMLIMITVDRIYGGNGSSAMGNSAS
ncbi:MAG: TIGR03618 family F420-dependent PPOX class oxidoreductase [Thermomicrobiales bacterium]